MKNIFAIILNILLIIKINSNFLRHLVPGNETNTYNYSTISAVSVNTNLESQTINATEVDQSVVYVTNPGVTISNSNLNKVSGNSSDLDNSEFYGVNAVVLVNGGGLTIKDGSITTACQGSNGVCATLNGTLTITGTKIISTPSAFARGMLSTFGGKINGYNLTISSIGRSSANLATDKGEGTISCTGCNLSTAGRGSPLMYSTGDITIINTNGTSAGAQAVAIEGKNKATIKDKCNVKCSGNGGMNDNCGFLIYQSQPGDPTIDRSIFTCENSNIEIMPSSDVYSSALCFIQQILKQKLI